MKKIKRNKLGPDGYEDDDPTDPDFPSGNLVQVPDFLPPPEDLFPEVAGMVKVTIALKKESIDFFRKKARENHTKYQRMIREVLDRYVAKYSNQ
jgi:hypothetical protein